MSRLTTDRSPTTHTYDLAGDHHLSMTCTSAFPITPYTQFLLNNLPSVEGKRVLDFGTGSGILGIAAAELGARSVLACDISEDALALARTNAEANGIRNLKAFLLQPGREHEHLSTHGVDVILCNPASLPTPSSGACFWSGGTLGTTMLLQLVELASWALAPAGSIRFIHTSLTPLHITLRALSESTFSAAIVQVTKIPFRPFYGPLLEYFSFLRSQGRIYFEGGQDTACHELLYLVDAQRFPGSEYSHDP